MRFGTSFLPHHRVSERNRQLFRRRLNTVDAAGRCEIFHISANFFKLDRGNLHTGLNHRPQESARIDQSALLAGSKKLSQCQSWQREIGDQSGALRTPVLADSTPCPRYRAPLIRGRPSFSVGTALADPIEQFKGKRSAQRADSTHKKVHGHPIGL